MTKTKSFIFVPESPQNQGWSLKDYRSALYEDVELYTCCQMFVSGGWYWYCCHRKNIKYV